jgi:hypothetical protein
LEGISDAAIKSVQTIGTTDELLALGDAALTCAGRAMIRNIGSTTVELGSDGSTYPIILEAGDFCLTRFNINEIHGKALVSNGILEYTITGDDKAAIPLPQVMESDASVADAFATKDWGSDENDVWLSFGLFFDSAALTFWNGDSGSGVFAGMLDNIDGPKCMLNVGVSVAGEWYFHGSANDSAGSAVAGAWNDCEMHFVNGGTCEFYVGGVLTASYTDGGNTVTKIQMGQVGADPNAASIANIRNVKVGTTRHGSELFADNFATGDFTNWDSTSGTVTVIAPF